MASIEINAEGQETIAQKTAPQTSDEPIIVPFKVVIDSREKNPYHFLGIKADADQGCRPLLIPNEVATIKTGDYSIRGFESIVAVERKSKDDLYKTIGQERDRFEDEHRRLQSMGVAAVVIEATWDDLLKNPPQGSRLNPKTIYRTALSWSVKYGIPWHCVPGRRLGEITTFRILEKFWEYRDRISIGGIGGAR